MYDYLVVGAGLYGAVFAHEALKKGKGFWLLIRELILLEIFILRKLRGLMCINMVHIFFIQIISRYGNT